MTTATARVPHAIQQSTRPQAAAAFPGAPAAPPEPAADASPLSAEHLRQLDEARARAKRIRRCAAVATFDGWSVGVFGALTLLCGLFSVWGWVLGGGMLLIGYVELSTVARMKRLEPTAARRLGWNQLALGSLLLAYACWSLYGAWFGPDPFAATIAAAPETAQLLAPYEPVARLISAAVYIALAGVAVFAQGGTALYYFTREKHIRAYREQTPAWIITFQQAGGQV